MISVAALRTYLSSAKVPLNSPICVGYPLKTLTEVTALPRSSTTGIVMEWATVCRSWPPPTKVPHDVNLRVLCGAPTVFAVDWSSGGSQALSIFEGAVRIATPP